MPKTQREKDYHKDEYRLLRLCCRALEDKKAEDIRIMDVRKQSSITDFLVIASGNSDPHLKALNAAVATIMKEEGVVLAGIETDPGSGWSVFDAYEIMVHLFLPETRNIYRLEALWNDATEISAAELAGFHTEPAVR